MSVLRVIATYLCVGLGCVFSCAYAQQGDIPEEVTRQLNKNLEELHEISRQLYFAYESEASVPSKTPAIPNLNAVEVTSQTDLKEGASISSKTLGSVDRGIKLPVIGQAGEWFAVDFSQKEPLGKTDSEKKAAWISAKNVVPQVVSKTKNVGLIDFLQEKLLKKAFEMREEFQKNPYIGISGFSISTTPPSLTMNFEFK